MIMVSLLRWQAPEIAVQDRGASADLGATQRRQVAIVEAFSCPGGMQAKACPVSKGGVPAQGDEPDWVGDWLEIRSSAVMRMAALVIGAVL